MIDVMEIVRKLERKGASEAEVVMWRNRRFRVSFSEEISDIIDLELISVSLRVAVNKKIAVIGVEDISSENIERKIEEIIRIARASSEDPYWGGLNTVFGKTVVEEIYNKELDEVSYDDVRDIIRTMVDNVHDVHPKVSVSRGSFNILRTEYNYANSYSNEILKRSENSFGGYIWVRADVDNIGTFSDFFIGRSIKKDFDPAYFSRKVAERSLEFSRARKTTTGKYKIIFENSVAGSILTSVFSPAVSAETIFRKRSPLIDKIGTQIFDDKISIVDDGTIGRYIGAREFDDEGHPTQRTILVEKGILKTYLYDSYYAKLLNTRSTGNAWRGLASSPRPSHNVLIFEPGDLEINDLIKEVRRGIYVVRVIGEWLSNPVSGYVQATITHAYEIENGEIREPLKGGTLTMNLYENLKRSFIGASKETRATPARIVAPSIAVDNVSIS
jgi:PmbA protein